MTLRDTNGNLHTWQSEVLLGQAMLPRVETITEEVVLDDGTVIFKTTLGNAINVPPKVDDVLYVVSSITYQAIKLQHPDRDDFVVPGRIHKDNDSMWAEGLQQVA